MGVRIREFYPRTNICSNKLKNAAFSHYSVPPAIFISHSFKDKELAKRIKGQLMELDLTCYLAEDDPQYGKSLTKKIMGAIDRCKLVIAVLTKNGALSASVNQEIGYAKKAGKDIIPLVEEGVDPALFMIEGEWAEFSKDKEDDSIDAVTKFTKKKLKAKFGEEWMIFLAVMLIILAAVIAAYYSKKR